MDGAAAAGARVRPVDGTGWRPELRATLALAWPLVIANLSMTAMTTTDVMMMGWISAGTLAAGTLAAQVYYAVMVFGWGVVTAAAPMMAQERGRRRHAVRDLRRTVRQGLWVAVSLALPSWLVLWNTDAILRLLGQDPALAAEAGRYARTLQWALLPFLGFMVLRSFTSVLDRPGWALAVSVAAIAVNAAANYVLMFGKLGFPALGLVGSGIATTVSSVFLFAALAIVLHLHPHFRRYRVLGRWWRADWPRFLAVWRLGLPIGITLLIEVTIFSAAAFIMGLCGTAALAAHAIALQIASMTFMVPLGLAQAATVRVGYHHGAGDHRSVTVAARSALVVALAFMASMSAVMLLAPQVLVAAFLDLRDPANAEVMALAMSFLAYAALFQVADGAQCVGAGLLRGLSDTRVPMLYAGLGYWGIGAPLALLLAFPMGLVGHGVWIGLAAALAIVAVLMLRRWSQREALGLTARPLAPPGGSRP